MEITLKGRCIQAALNGVQVNDFDPDPATVLERTKELEPKRGPRAESGSIGLQNHDDCAPGSHLFFEELSVKAL
jgi:hypothetical protein